MLAFCLLSLFKGLRQINQNSTHQGRIIPCHRVLALSQALLGVLTSRDLPGRRERGRRVGLGAVEGQRAHIRYSNCAPRNGRGSRLIRLPSSSDRDLSLCEPLWRLASSARGMPGLGQDQDLTVEEGRYRVHSGQRSVVSPASSNARTDCSASDIHRRTRESQQSRSVGEAQARHEAYGAQREDGSGYAGGAAGRWRTTGHGVGVARHQISGSDSRNPGRKPSWRRRRRRPRSYLPKRRLRPPRQPARCRHSAGRCAAR